MRTEGFLIVHEHGWIGAMCKFRCVCQGKYATINTASLGGRNIVLFDGGGDVWIRRVDGGKLPEEFFRWFSVQTIK